MSLATPGIHHVTAIAADPGRNLAFYTETLGLRLVKRSVNQDDPGVYHLFYGDRVGSPGTSLTFFPYPEANPGRAGTGQATAVGLAIPPDAVSPWLDRLDDHDVDRDEPRERFGETVVPFRDPDGLDLELVARPVAAGEPPDGPVPEAQAIRGFADVTLTVTDGEAMTGLLTAMGYRTAGRDDGLRRFEASGERGAVLFMREDPSAERGRQGAGTVHHVAFRVTEAEQSAWRELLVDHGLRPTDIVDRKWFSSVYTRTPVGVLFEFATETPGYTVDEPVAELGSGLVLPPWLEEQRAEIEAQLPPLDRSVVNR
ncbi:MAG: ring-cleaving dioxygenase [Halodesulfurarchaeum sp.]